LFKELSRVLYKLRKIYYIPKIYHPQKLWL